MITNYIFRNCIININLIFNINNRFFYGDKEWTCSWRMAGGIVADIIKDGNYMDWYCSGNESVVTDEIKLDLMIMGWTVKPYEPRLQPGIYRNEWK